MPTISIAADNNFINSKSYITVNPYPNLIIHSGKTIVTIKSDGTVEYEGTLEESAQAFWDQVRAMGFKLKCEKKD